MAGLSTTIAWRYLFGKKSTNAINLITALSIIGIMIGTAALILILSVFNGFESLLSGLVNAFNPDLKIAPERGKHFNITPETLQKIQGLEGVKLVATTLEEVALFDYKDVQEIGMIKGVDAQYKKVTGLDSLLLLGRFNLQGKSGLEYGVLGVGMRNKLSVNIEDKLNPVTVYMLNQKVGFNAKEFKSKDFYPNGVFSVRSETDQQYIICSMDFARSILSLPANTYSYLELKTTDDADMDQLRKELSDQLGAVSIKNKYEQDSESIRVMNIEKWVSFLIVSLTMLLIAFNLVCALWMIILEKKKDIALLKAVGYTDQKIRQLFLWLGVWITALGIIIGFVLSVFIYFLQKKYGIIGIPEGFLIDAYPIKLKLIDFFRVAATVMVIGFIAALLPAVRAAQMGTYLRTE